MLSVFKWRLNVSFRRCFTVVDITLLVTDDFPCMGKRSKDFFKKSITLFYGQYSVQVEKDILGRGLSLRRGDDG